MVETTAKLGRPRN